MSGRRVPVVIAITLATLLAPAAAAPAAAPSGTAADGPGSMSHFGLARKDCVRTARNRGSKVWYTIADGVLSDVYFPTSGYPHCTVAPGSVPKAMDVLTPAGVNQADELDYTLHNPVVIAPVTIP